MSSSAAFFPVLRRNVIKLAAIAALLAAECNIFGSYALLTRPRGRAALALHVEDNECAVAVLESQQFTILGQSDISR